MSDGVYDHDLSAVNECLMGSDAIDQELNRRI